MTEKKDASKQASLVAFRKKRAERLRDAAINDSGRRNRRYAMGVVPDWLAELLTEDQEMAATAILGALDDQGECPKDHAEIAALVGCTKGAVKTAIWMMIAHGVVAFDIESGTLRWARR